MSRKGETMCMVAIGKHVEEEVQKCLVCSQFCHQNVEPLFPTNFPDYPWQKLQPICSHGKILIL